MVRRIALLAPTEAGGAGKTSTSKQMKLTLFRNTFLGVEDGVYIFQPKDARYLDEDTIRNWGEELFRIASETYGKVVIDFSNVEYLSSAAHGKLITFNKTMRASGQDYRYCGFTPQIYEVIRMLKLNKKDEYKISRNKESAIRELNEGEKND